MNISMFAQVIYPDILLLENMPLYCLVILAFSFYFAFGITSDGVIARGSDTMKSIVWHLFIFLFWITLLDHLNLLLSNKFSTFWR
jgi:hypothetical protein